MIQDEPIVPGIDCRGRIEVREAGVRHSVLGGQVLQIAMTVRDADGADVIPLGKEQFKDHQAILAEARAGGFNVHALGDLGGAGGQQFVRSGDFHDAEPAGADVAETFQVTERRYVNSRVGGDLEDRFRFVRADGFTVDG